MIKADNKLFIFLGLAVILLLPACVKKTKSSKLSRVSIGMSKRELESVLGEPNTIRGAMINNFQQTIETWEYQVDSGFNDKKMAAMQLFGYVGASWYFNDPYWFFFCDNKLVKWCKAGDWETIQHEIKEIRFR